jgi:tetratricopeptide (TPR) repeat protein
MARRENDDEDAGNEIENPYSLEFDLPDPKALKRSWNYTDRADRLYQAGHGALSRGFFAEADSRFERAARYDRSHYMAYVGRSEALVLLGENETAVEILRVAADRYGRNCAIGAALGHVYLHLGHGEEAFQCTDIATVNDADNAYAWLIAGEARLTAKGGHRFAERSFDRAREAQEKWPYLELRIALAYLEWGPRDKAKANLKAFTTEHPEVPLGWILLGDTYRVMGRARAARMCYKRALDLAPELESVRRALSWTSGIQNVWRGLRQTVRRVFSG